MKLLYVCADPGIPPDGTKGASIHVRQTVAGLASRGVEVTLLCARTASGSLPCRLVPVEARGPRAFARANGLAARDLAQLAHTRCLAQRGAPYATRSDVIYERYALWSLAGWRLARRAGRPWVVEVNAPLPEEQARYRHLALARAARALERAMARRADLLLPVSSALAERLARLRGTDRGVHLFPNAVDTKRFRPAAEPPPHPPTLIFTGSLKPWHGLDGLLEAFARLRARGQAARLEIVGEGPERPRLERLAASFGLVGAVRFTGAVPHEEIPARLARATLALAPYPAIQPFYFSPLKVLEYLAAGLPVIASRCGDLARWLRDGEDALLVPPGDVGALAQAMEALLLDPQRRRHLATRARARAERVFSLERALDRLLELLGEAAGAEVRPWSEGAAR